MALTQTAKIAIIISCCVVGAAAIVTPTTLVFLNNSTEVNFTLLYNAGVMIETENVRIYVDPYNISYSYHEYPADIILITHPHGDHYDPAIINFLKTDDTLIVCPENMTEAIATFGATGVNPGDNFVHMGINITAFYMYTEAPEGYTPSHPPEANWTSYIIDTGDFTFFHAGDSANIAEYTQISNQIDVALLPLGPGCQTMTGIDVVYAIDTINPIYMVPIHFAEGADVAFCAVYEDMITNAGCQLVHLNYFQSHVFEI